MHTCNVIFIYEMQKICFLCSVCLLGSSEYLMQCYWTFSLCYKQKVVLNVNQMYTISYVLVYFQLLHSCSGHRGLFIRNEAKKVVYDGDKTQSESSVVFFLMRTEHGSWHLIHSCMKNIFTFLIYLLRAQFLLLQCDFGEIYSVIMWFSFNATLDFLQSQVPLYGPFHIRYCK